MYYQRQESPHDVSKLLKLMTEVVRFEAITELTFDYLKVVAPTKQAAMFLEKMLQDERNHTKEFKKLYFTLTSQQAAGDPPTFEIPESFGKGIRDIFSQKLEIIEIYKRIKQLSPYSDLRDKMNDFIQDELQHLAMINHLIITQPEERRMYDFRSVPYYTPISYS